MCLKTCAAGFSDLCSKVGEEKQRTEEELICTNHGFIRVLLLLFSVWVCLLNCWGLNSGSSQWATSLSHLFLSFILKQGLSQFPRLGLNYNLPALASQTCKTTGLYLAPSCSFKDSSPKDTAVGFYFIYVCILPFLLPCLKVGGRGWCVEKRLHPNTQIVFLSPKFPATLLPRAVDEERGSQQLVSCWLQLSIKSASSTEAYVRL